MADGRERGGQRRSWRKFIDHRMEAALNRKSSLGVHTQSSLLLVLIFWVCYDAIRSDPMRFDLFM